MKATNNRWTRTVLAAGLAAGLGLVASTAHAGKVDFGEKGHVINPMWSLDGKHLAFEVNTFGGDGIAMYFAEVNGDTATSTQRVKLPGGGGPYGSQQVVMNATWHPQGLAVFEGSNAGGQFRLYFAQPGGAMAAEMLDNQKASGNLQFPVVAPNGNLLGYISDQFGKGDVMSWDRSSNTIAQQTDTGSVSESFPFFSADGSTLLYIEKGNAATVHEVTIGGESKVIASGNGDQTRPIYAGDKVLFFTSERGEGNWDLVQINRGGGGKKVLAKGVKLPERARPAVSPDGKFVAYVYSDPTKDRSVRIMDLATGSEKEVKTEYTACGEPSLTKQNGRYKLAYTALPSDDSDWKFLYITDVTNVL